MGKTTKQESRTRLTQPLRGYAQQQLKSARNLYQQYQGMDLPSMYVPISQQRGQALGMAEQIAGGGNMPLETILPEWQRTVGGYYLDPAQNPYYERWAQAAAAPVISGMAGAGRLGSGIAANLMTDARTGVAARMYEAERARQNQALGMAPMVEDLQYQPAARLGAVGAQYEQDQLAQQAEAMRQFQFPWMLEQMYQGQLRGSPLTGEANTFTTLKQPFDWASMVGAIFSPPSLFGG